MFKEEIKISKLSKEEIEFITKCLKESKPLPDNYRYIITFETKKEYELTYEGKEREIEKEKRYETSSISNN